MDSTRANDSCVSATFVVINSVILLLAHSSSFYQTLRIYATMILNPLGASTSHCEFAAEVLQVVASYVGMLSVFMLRFAYQSLTVKLTNKELLTSIAYIYGINLVGCVIASVTPPEKQVARAFIYTVTALMVESGILEICTDSSSGPTQEPTDRMEHLVVIWDLFPLRVLHRARWMLSGREEWILRFQEFRHTFAGSLVEKGDKKIIEGDGDKSERTM